VRFVIVRHRYEKHRQSNTGAVAHRVLENSELVGFGDRGESVDLESLCDNNRDNFVLFPIEGASPLERAMLPDPEQTSIIVLDSSWRQARRMSRRIAGLRTLPFLSLPPAEVPDWQLRRASGPATQTTIEAIATAVEILGHSAAAGELRAAHELFAKSIRERWARYPNPGHRE
jgi:DTW domain-containing protein YfiP